MGAWSRTWEERKRQGVAWGEERRGEKCKGMNQFFSGSFLRQKRNLDEDEMGKSVLCVGKYCINPDRERSAGLVPSIDSRPMQARKTGWDHHGAYEVDLGTGTGLEVRSSQDIQGSKRGARWTWRPFNPSSFASPRSRVSKAI